MNKLVILVVVVVFIFLLSYDPKSRKLEKYISTPKVLPVVNETISKPMCSEEKYHQLIFNTDGPKCSGQPVEYLGAVMQA